MQVVPSIRAMIPDLKPDPASVIEVPSVVMPVDGRTDVTVGAARYSVAADKVEICESEFCTVTPYDPAVPMLGIVQVNAVLETKVTFVQAVVPM